MLIRIESAEKQMPPIKPARSAEYKTAGKKIKNGLEKSCCKSKR
jgi:hypothetical protein